MSRRTSYVFYRKTVPTASIHSGQLILLIKFAAVVAFGEDGTRAPLERPNGPNPLHSWITPRGRFIISEVAHLTRVTGSDSKLDGLQSDSRSRDNLPPRARLVIEHRAYRIFGEVLVLRNEETDNSACGGYHVCLSCRNRRGTTCSRYF